MSLIATWFSEGRRAQHPPDPRWAYADCGFSGGNMERPALQDLLADIRASRIDIVVIYKVDRLTRSLADFARLAEIFDAQGAAFVCGAVRDIPRIQVVVVDVDSSAGLGRFPRRCR